MSERINLLAERELDNKEKYDRRMWEEELMKYKGIYQSLPEQSREKLKSCFEANCKAIDYIMGKNEGVKNGNKQS
jgi:hypothetical protein